MVAGRSLFDLRLLVHDVFADLGIKLLDLHLSGHGTFVLCGGVKVAGSGAGYEFDLVAHDVLPLDLFTAGAQISQHGVYALLIDDAHAIG